MYIYVMESFDLWIIIQIITLIGTAEIEFLLHFNCETSH